MKKDTKKQKPISANLSLLRIGVDMPQDITVTITDGDGQLLFETSRYKIALERLEDLKDFESSHAEIDQAMIVAPADIAETVAEELKSEFYKTCSPIPAA